jgi:hypothetical protein
MEEKGLSDFEQSGNGVEASAVTELVGRTASVKIDVVTVVIKKEF